MKGIMPLPSAPASQIRLRPGPRLGRWKLFVLVAWLLLVLLGLALAGLAYQRAERSAIDRLRVAAGQRLDSYAGSLENLLAKYEFLPGALELNKDVIALLQHPDDAALRADVNDYLEQLNRQSHSTTMYLVSLRGVTQAASNWRQADSFVGDDVSFRPYVRDALRRAPGGFYGVGTTRGEPGYFFAHGIYHHGQMLGVATVKVNIEKLEASWVQGADKVLLSDAHGVVFLASSPAWKYRTLAPLPAAVQQELSATRQYHSHPLTPLNLTEQQRLDAQARIVEVFEPGMAGVSMLSQSRSLAPRNWQFVYLSDLAPARASARYAFLFTCVLEGFVVMLVLFLRQRRRALRQRQRARDDLQRAYDHLETKVADRTASLQATTLHLSEEIAVRRQAEQKLRQTQDELVQAGKLAVLGQMSAGITHELNQPLTALRTMSDNAAVLLDRGRLDDARSNLATISQIVARMGTLTGQLKEFARKSATAPVPVAVAAAVAGALFLVERRVERERVNFRLSMRCQDAHALCDGNRLEQVLVNLFNNALDAMAESPLKQLTVCVDGIAGGLVQIVVSDTGTGLPEEVRQRLFEPFFTTKSQGQGLGLGLAISEQIVRESGGVLLAEPAPDGGARFVIELPMAQQESRDD
jgi:two-component system C4-dicarboxylate transport sensor histidine kinase DctB